MLRSDVSSSYCGGRCAAVSTIGRCAFCFYGLPPEGASRDPLSCLFGLLQSSSERGVRQRVGDGGLPGWAFRIRTSGSVGELPDWICVTTGLR